MLENISAHDINHSCNFIFILIMNIEYSSSSPNSSNSSECGVINSSFDNESEGLQTQESPDVTISEINKEYITSCKEQGNHEIDS